MRHRLTCSQLLKTHYEWCSGVDEGGIFDVITIDFRKAFDVVPHLKLLSKVSNLGECEQTVLWLASFLPGRQCVRVNSRISSHANVSSGVIQGRLLCPLLFTLYINDLPSLCSDCVVKLFADNVKVYKRIRCAEDRIVLQSVLNKICTWTVDRNLALSVEKCCYFQIGYKDNVFSSMLDFNILSPMRFHSRFGCYNPIQSKGKSALL